MNLNERISNDIKVAMREKDKDVLQTLRAVKTAITNFEKTGKGEVTDTVVLDIVKKQVKQRKDSIEAFNTAKRWELADKERVELNILSNYLPKQLSEEEVKTTISGIISELGASNMKDMGKVMAACKQQFAGAADNSLVSKLVKTQLS